MNLENPYQSPADIIESKVLRKLERPSTGSLLIMGIAVLIAYVICPLMSIVCVRLAFEQMTFSNSVCAVIVVILTLVEMWLVSKLWENTKELAKLGLLRELIELHMKENTNG